MAITWDVQITKVNLDTKRADVIATRVDDQLETTNTYRYTSVPLETPAQRQSILETIKNAVEEEELVKAQISNFIDNLESSGKAALETWEASR